VSGLAVLEVGLLEAISVWLLKLNSCVLQPGGKKPNIKSKNKPLKNDRPETANSKSDVQ